MKVLNIGTGNLENGSYRFFVYIGDTEDPEGLVPLMLEETKISWDYFIRDYGAAMYVLRSAGYEPEEYQIWHEQSRSYMTLRAFFGV